MGSEALYAQWTANDSIRLHNILSGKDSLRLNPEVEQSIREGTFLNLDKKRTQFREPEREKLSIELDMSDWNIRPERSPWKTAEEIKQLPPQVFWLYKPELSDRDEWGRKKAVINMGISEYLASLRIYRKSKFESLDFNHVLSSAFSPHYRQLEKNKETAKAYKTYNSLPSPEILAKRKEYLKRHPEAALTKEKKDSISISIAFENDSIHVQPTDSLPFNLLNAPSSL